MRASIKIMASLESREVWRRFVPPPPVELIYDDDKLQFGQWEIRYDEIPNHEVFYDSDGIQISIYFPEWMKTELAKKGIYMQEVELDKSTSEASSILKPLDHVHILIDKENGESLLAKISNSKHSQ